MSSEHLPTTNLSPLFPSVSGFLHKAGFVCQKRQTQANKPTYLKFMIQKKARSSPSVIDVWNLWLTSLGHMHMGRWDRKEQGTWLTVLPRPHGRRNAPSRRARGPSPGKQNPQLSTALCKLLIFQHWHGAWHLVAARWMFVAWKMNKHLADHNRVKQGKLPRSREYVWCSLLKFCHQLSQGPKGRPLAAAGNVRQAFSWARPCPSPGHGASRSWGWLDGSPGNELSQKLPVYLLLWLLWKRPLGNFFFFFFFFSFSDILLITSGEKFGGFFFPFLENLTNSLAAELFHWRDGGQG